MDSSSLTDKVAIITGGSRGIGAGIAYELARRGAKVVITYTSPTSTPQVESLLSGINALHPSTTPRSTSILADLRNPSSPSEIIAHTLSTFGPHIDILINNAGAELVKPLPDITIDDFASIYDLNVRAPVLLLQSVLPHLRPNSQSRIINIGSVGSRAGFPDLSIYCSSKSAMEGLTRCWAAEIGRYGCGKGTTVNMVNPGPIETEMIGNIPTSIVEMQKANTPVENRMGKVEDVAVLVGWLCSEESRWVSGQVLSASGGFAMY